MKQAPDEGPAAREKSTSPVQTDGRSRTMRIRLSAKNVSVAALLAAAYAAMVQVLHPISFLQFQVRVANALMGLVPLLGMPAVYGLTIGVFLANLASPLGWIDLLSPVPSFVGLLVIYKSRGVSVFLGLTAYSILLGAWVAFMLWYTVGLPYLITLLYVTVGIWIATAVLGYITYALAKRMLPSWVRA